MIKCTNCGAENGSENLFCHACGEKLEKEQELVYKCSKCGAKNDVNNQFCPICGAKFGNYAITANGEQVEKKYANPKLKEKHRKKKAIVITIISIFVVTSIVSVFCITKYYRRRFPVYFQIGSNYIYPDDKFDYFTDNTDFEMKSYFEGGLKYMSYVYGDVIVDFDNNSASAIDESEESIVLMPELSLSSGISKEEAIERLCKNYALEVLIDDCYYNYENQDCSQFDAIKVIGYKFGEKYQNDHYYILSFNAFHENDTLEMVTIH